jgi:glutathione S-transferase
MRLVLHDLVGREDRRFSPTCWRVKLALAHKGLPFTTVPTRFLAIREIGDGSFKTVPTLQAGERWITDSDAIAAWLEETWPARPSLFGGEGGRVLTAFVRQWVQLVLHGQIAQLVLLDIHDHLADTADQAYFRASREAQFKASLEAVVASREERVAPFRASLEPLRQVVRERPFLGGTTPLYADYMVMGAFQWARSVSPFARTLLAADDPVRAYLERLLDAHDGLARQAIAYPL